MQSFLYIVVIGVLAVNAQENAQRNVPSSLLECYNNTYLLEKDSRLPHNINTLIAILRKIENTAGLNMDLRGLSVALLHRFRQDGIERNHRVQAQNGITPYAPNGLQFYRGAATLRLIPGNAVTFPNNSLSDVERCTLHFMLSSSIEIIERGDEATTCRVTNNLYRNERSVNEESESNTENIIIDDVETLSPEQLEIMKSNNGERKMNTVDPNWLYPELPPNHPDSAKVMAIITPSRCPVENGVIKTPWGAVAGGPLLAGIAAALQPQTVSLSSLLREELIEKGYDSAATLDNKWIATFAGDLAEVALVQGPDKPDKILSVGVNGNWNSTALPKWYFLSTNENLEFTTAEIRGDLDGLILANYVASWYSRTSTIRLSQILDMYYSPRGVFNSTIRACNRRTLLTSVAPNATIAAQAYIASLLLSEDVATATIDPARIETFVTYSTNQLLNYIPTSMNSDLTCTITDAYNDINRASVDLTIILDTNWPFSSIQPILGNLLESIEVGMFNSNFTLINAFNGSIMIDSSNSILNFYNFNSSNYQNHTTGFDLAKTFETLRLLQTDKLNSEQRLGIGGRSSDIVLIIPYTSTVSETDKQYCLEQLRTMREEVPDATILFLTYGSKDRWSDLVFNPSTDIFAITSGDTTSSLEPIGNLVARIKRNQKRLINSQCGANFVSSGSSNSFIDYVEPSGVNFYRLHPNYFFTAESSNLPTVKVQGAGWGTLTVCTSRNVLHVNTTEALAAASCTSVTSNTYSFTVSCPDASVIHQCQPLYVAVFGNVSSSSSYQCTDASVCRFPDMLKYTFSYENLLCRSGASSFAKPVILILSIICFYFY
ncbi:uncharacterized protein LOC107264077 [Cephus cinctus]|uniref:Uncharacterized protein LOC107264077 n=1 Tax=Cephus cinctus TaxID=211228 RepID=A0AAJ7FE83_CEPCN|nr:uncharacterized protein LOC107264077 [Cephus cinctus]